MPKKVNLKDLNEHLFDMVERLLNDQDICVDKESTEIEIQRAAAISNVADKIIDIKKTEVVMAETEIKMFNVAEQLGKTYVPEKIHAQELQTAKKKLLTEGIN